jgi:hypothetical protein
MGTAAPRTGQRVAACPAARAAHMLGIAQMPDAARVAPGGSD